MVIKKHLCRQEFTACIHFFLQMIQILKNSVRFRVSLRIAGAADAEISLCFDVRDQLTRMTVLVRKREIRILRNVSPERQNIADLLLL